MILLDPGHNLALPSRYYIFIMQHFFFDGSEFGIHGFEVVAVQAGLLHDALDVFQGYFTQPGTKIEEIKKIYKILV